jgi:uncharacterized membrane protein (UPF0127 family)
MRLTHKTTKQVLLNDVAWCDSFFSRLRGLMFRRVLGENEGIVLVERRESRLDTSIHMLFMFFSIAVVWLDSKFRVVDVRLAKPWRLFYAPRAPAQYVIEASPSLLEKISIGDELIFEK